LPRPTGWGRRSCSCGSQGQGQAADLESELAIYIPKLLAKGRVFNDLIDDFTKSDFKSFWDDFEIFKIILKYGDLIW
jgi:hypothetical protein